MGADPVLGDIHVSCLSDGGRRGAVIEGARSPIALFVPLTLALSTGPYTRGAEEIRVHPQLSVRLFVKPGITGWAQVRYPYGASVKDAEEKLSYDLYYIKHYSVGFDLAVILQTPQVMIWGKGAR
jgi:hypothetical protein